MVSRTFSVAMEKARDTFFPSERRARQSSALSPKPPAYCQGSRFTFRGTYPSCGPRWEESVVTEGEVSTP